MSNDSVPDSMKPLARCTPGELRGIAEARAKRELLQLRSALNYSQLRLSQELNVNVTTVEDWERGATRVPAWALIACRALLIIRRATGS